MSNVIELDFRGAPPAQGGGGTDVVPAGRYPLRVDRVEQSKTNAGRSMIVVHFKVAVGEYAGSRLRDRFVLPSSPDDSKFGLQRLHAFIVAFGSEIGERKVKLDLDQFVGKVVLADVQDNSIPATDRYPERKTSEPIAYHNASTASQSGTRPVPSQAAQTRPTARPTEEAAPPVVNGHDVGRDAGALIEAAINEVEDLFK